MVCKCFNIKDQLRGKQRRNNRRFLPDFLPESKRKKKKKEKEAMQRGRGIISPYIPLISMDGTVKAAAYLGTCASASATALGSVCRHACPFHRPPMPTPILTPPWQRSGALFSHCVPQKHHYRNILGQPTTVCPGGAKGRKLRLDTPTHLLDALPNIWDRKIWDFPSFPWTSRGHGSAVSPTCPTSIT